jgi:hypothetical protein
MIRNHHIIRRERSATKYRGYLLFVMLMGGFVAFLVTTRSITIILEMLFGLFVVTAVWLIIYKALTS